jgi:hypothetical protein
MALRVPMVLLAVLLPGYGVQAAETAVLTLSCDGTVTRLEVTGDYKPERVANMGLLVNLPEGTITGFVHAARIDNISEVLVDFSGNSGNAWSVYGSMDRITGRVTANTASRDSKTGTLIDERQWDLLCKPAKRLF